MKIALPLTLFNRKAAFVTLSLVVTVPFMMVYTQVVPVGIDWLPIRKGVLSLLSGHGYVDGFFNPPWTAIILAPLAVLPIKIGGALVSVINLFVFGFVAYRLGAKPLPIYLLLTSAPVVGGTGMGNIDWIVALGLLLSPQLGLFLVLVKPHVGLGIALFWFWKALRVKGWREVLRVFSPVSLAFLISFILYGPYLLGTSLSTRVWTSSLLPFAVPLGNTIPIFPFAVPFGLAFLAYSIRDWKLETSAGVGVLLVPYLSFPSFSLLLLSLVRHTWLLVIIWVLLWAYALSL